MKRFLITFCAHRAEDTGRMLRTAAKVAEDLQAVGMACCLVQTEPPWQLALEGEGEPSYIRQQILDICDGRLGVAILREI